MGEITEAVVSAIGSWGLYAVFVLSVVDAVLPAASELVMVYGGAVASGAFAGSGVVVFGEQVESTLWGFVAMAVAGTVGYVLGSVLGWAIGVYGGRPLLERHGRWFHLTPKKLDTAERWFERRGDAAVLVSRLVPVIRSFISIPAGIARMRLGRYTVLTAAGSVPWYFGLAAVGVAVGAGWQRFHEAWHYADYTIGALLVAGALYLLFRLRRRRARRHAVGRAA